MATFRPGAERLDVRPEVVRWVVVTMVALKLPGPKAAPFAPPPGLHEHQSTEAVPRTGAHPTLPRSTIHGFTGSRYQHAQRTSGRHTRAPFVLGNG